MQTENTNFIYKNELDKACFQHDMAYGKSKDLAKRTQSDKVFRKKVFRIESDPKYDGYQADQLQWFTSFLIKNLLRLINLVEVELVMNQKPNYQLPNELHKPIIRRFKKTEVHSYFRDNIWGVDLVDMPSLST